MRVHGIARRTLFDPANDEQPFCQGLTERRRTIVRFLGQQSEVTIDDTWPQAGEVRSLWKGITEFWTDDMPRTPPGEPKIHQSNIIPFFRNHVTQNAVAMFPPPPNPVISIEHGYRDYRLSSVPHTEDAEEKGRRVVLGMSELSNVYSSHHYEPSGTTESQYAATEAADPSCQRQDYQRRDVDTSWSSPGQMAREMEIRVSCAGPSSTTKERSLEPVQRKLVTDEEKYHSNRTVEGRTELWKSQQARTK